MTRAPSPIAVGLELLIAIVVLVVLAALAAHLEYRRRFPQPRGRELDAIGLDWNVPRNVHRWWVFTWRESDRRFRRRLRDHVAITMRRSAGRAAGMPNANRRR